MLERLCRSSLGQTAEQGVSSRQGVAVQGVVAIAVRAHQHCCRLSAASADIYTTLGIYSGNPWKVKPTIYSAKL